MTINCGIENQTELFRADLPLRASYSLLQSTFNESVNRNKIFRTGPFFSEKIVPPGMIFPEKIGPGPNFRWNKISMTDLCIILCHTAKAHVQHTVKQYEFIYSFSEIVQQIAKSS